MSHGNQADTGPCLAPGVIMALMDGQLQGRESAAARSHLQSCTRCQQIADDLAATAGMVRTQLSCLDDEAIASYVDHKTGRVGGAISRAELDRTRRHLQECPRCRARAKLLEAACGTQVSLWDWVRGLVLGSGEGKRPAPGFAWRAAAVATSAAVLVLTVYLVAKRPGPSPPSPPPGRQVSQVPGSYPRGSAGPPPTGRAPGVRGPGAASDAGAPGGAQEQGTQPPVVPPPVAPSSTETGREPGVSSAPSVPPRIETRTETALVPPKGASRAEIAGVMAPFDRAKKSGDAGQLARAALAVGGLYHRNREYRLAADYYRQAAAAGERAGSTELRIDALILLGAVKAEQGQIEAARQQFETALKLARDAGYTKGEQNAQVQLQLLHGE